MSVLDPGWRPGQAGGDTTESKLMAFTAFSGECEGLDVDAAAELRRAGYEVFRLPDEYRGRLAHPLDDFIEAHIECADDPRDGSRPGGEAAWLPQRRSGLYQRRKRSQQPGA